METWPKLNLHTMFRTLYVRSILVVRQLINPFQPNVAFRHPLKMSEKRGLKPWFLVNFNIMLRHTFPENFIEFPRAVQKT